MEQRLVTEYEKELKALRHNAEAFATAYPKIASRLKLGQGNVEDPFVGRLMESFAFLTSQLRVDLAEEKEQLTENTLQLLYPDYFLPLPAYTTIEFTPSAQLDKSYTVKAGTAIVSPINDRHEVTFTTGYSVDVLPLTIKQVSYERVTDIQSLEHQKKNSRAVLTLTLATLGALPLSYLQCEGLRLFINAEEDTAGWLTTLLTETQLIDIEADDEKVTTLTPTSIKKVGFTKDEALLPYPNNSLQSHRLLSEYFAYPDKFNYINIDDLTILNALDSSSVTLKIYFNTYHTELENSVTEQLFKLNCTPVINLFEYVAEPVVYDQTRHQYHVIADNQLPPQYLEVYSINEVAISSQRYRDRIDSAPYYGRTYAQQKEEYLYWLPVRQSLASLGEYTLSGDEMFLQFQDSHINSLDEKLMLTPKVLCTNRTAASTLPYGGGQPALSFNNGQQDLIADIQCIRPITDTVYRDHKPSYHADLARFLMLNQAGLAETTQATEHLKQALALYAFSSRFHEVMIADGIVSVNPKVVTERHPALLRQGFCRGVDYQVTINEDIILPEQQYLFGEVLHQFLTGLSSLNTFVRLTLVSQQRGERQQWQAQLGKSSTL